MNGESTVTPAHTFHSMRSIFFWALATAVLER